jgi:hypothetical protein
VCQLNFSICEFASYLANYDVVAVVLLLGVGSLMAGLTTGVPMSPRKGGYQTATPPSYYTTTTYAMTCYYTRVLKCYIAKAPEYYTTTYVAPSYYTKAPKDYTEASNYYTSKAPKYYTTTYAAPAYYTEVPQYYTTKTPEYYTTRYYG